MQFTLKDLDPDKTVNDDRFPKDFFIEANIISYENENKIKNLLDFTFRFLQMQYFIFI